MDLDADREADEEEERENNEEVSVGVSISVDMNVLMREKGDRLKGAEVRLEGMKESMESKDREIKQFVKESRCRDIVVEGLNRRADELKEVVRCMSVRIEELENGKAERRRRVEDVDIEGADKERVVIVEVSERSRELKEKASLG